MSLRSRNAFIGAAICAALLLLTWLLAIHVGFFENLDRSVFNGFYDLHEQGAIPAIARRIADLCDPKPFLYLAAVPVLVALGRRRPWLALTIGVILVGANVSTQLLKPLIAVPRADPQFSGTWPSGHATAAMSLALTTVLAVPPRIRPTVAALGAAFAIAVSYSFLTLGWHYPSDVFGGFLVAATWTLVGAGALLQSGLRGPRRAVQEVQERISIQDALAPIAVTVLAAVVLAGLVLLVRPHEVASYAHAHKAFVFGAAAIGALGVALSTGIMLALRR